MSYTIIILPKAERNLRKLARIDSKAANGESKTKTLSALRYFLWVTTG
jgi:hypothetical protein